MFDRQSAEIGMIATQGHYKRFRQPLFLLMASVSLVLAESVEAVRSLSHTLRLRRGVAEQNDNISDNNKVSAHLV